MRRPGFRNVWADAPQAVGPDNFYDSTVEQYALQPLEVLSLRQMLEFGKDAIYDKAKVLKSARHAQRELPKRLARRLMDLQFLPHIFVKNPHIKRVYDAYLHAFDTLRSLPPACTPEDNARLTDILQRLVDEHAPMLDALASGLRESSSKPFVGPKLPNLDAFFDSMLRSRISRRVIAEQHIHLAQRRPGFIGVIATDFSLREAVDHAAQRTRQVCTETYGFSAEVVCTGNLRASIPYIPIHIDYMLFELLKNAMRAVVEAHRGRRGQPPPPVVVRICDAPSSVTLRISDQGGGIPEADIERVWSYGYTTADASLRSDSGGSGAQPASFGSTMTQMVAPSAGASGPWRMGGLGFGLPLSRLYARYFGGDLQLVSMPGYGVDAFLTLQHLEGDWHEPLAEHQSAPFEPEPHTLNAYP
ncbi:hypothetical protein WJX81_008336 [Elliptochloris bilobata]|uniref:Protein-serine/threonine kinase n=1 Tax=Elliptochloris bilobata TaxID=381761 RepID=A0AAW1SIL8_9CHLO